MAKYGKLRFGAILNKNGVRFSKQEQNLIASQGKIYNNAVRGFNKRTEKNLANAGIEPGEMYTGFKPLSLDLNKIRTDVEKKIFIAELKNSQKLSGRGELVNYLKGKQMSHLDGAMRNLANKGGLKGQMTYELYNSLDFKGKQQLYFRNFEVGFGMNEEDFYQDIDSMLDNDSHEILDDQLNWMKDYFKTNKSAYNRAKPFLKRLQKDISTQELNDNIKGIQKQLRTQIQKLSGQVGKIDPELAKKIERIARVKGIEEIRFLADTNLGANQKEYNKAIADYKRAFNYTINRVTDQLDFKKINDPKIRQTAKNLKSIVTNIDKLYNQELASINDSDEVIELVKKLEV